MTDDLRRVVREFRASVAADLAAQQRRLDEFAAEMRDRVSQFEARLRTTETAFLNELRDLSQRTDRRFDRVDAALAALAEQIDGLGGDR